MIRDFTWVCGFLTVGKSSFLIKWNHHLYLHLIFNKNATSCNKLTNKWNIIYLWWSIFIEQFYQIFQIFYFWPVIIYYLKVEHISENMLYTFERFSNLLSRRHIFSEQFAYQNDLLKLGVYTLLWWCWYRVRGTCRYTRNILSWLIFLVNHDLFC